MKKICTSKEAISKSWYNVFIYRKQVHQLQKEKEKKRKKEGTICPIVQRKKIIHTF